MLIYLLHEREKEIIIRGINRTHTKKQQQQLQNGQRESKISRENIFVTKRIL